MGSHRRLYSNFNQYLDCLLYIAYNHSLIFIAMIHEPFFASALNDPFLNPEKKHAPSFRRRGKPT